MSSNNPAPVELPANWPGERLISKRQLQTACGNVSSSTIQRWIKTGVLPPGIRIGKRRLFWTAKSVVAALENMPSGITDMKDAA